MRLLRNFAHRLWLSYMGFQEHEGSLAAAGIAYYLALSFFPLLLVLVAGLGWVLQGTNFGQDVQQRLLAAIQQQVSADLAQQVDRMLRLVSERAGTSGPIGFVVLVVSAIAIFAQLDSAFDRIWRLPSDPHETWVHWTARLLIVRLKALGMLMGMGAFVVAVMIASITLSAVERAMAPKFPEGIGMTWYLNLIVYIALNFVAFTAIYKIVPRKRVRWPEAIRGGLLAALLWEAGRQALAAYLLRLNYPSAYGVIGSFLAIMLWAYYASMVVLFGAEYVRVLRETATITRQKELELTEK
ncbi:MAG: YihY/virulence factor BrkB family protein [Planctomycetes bacterium]|nr:YihY/virulence factor BrkB family protein [Planctomycetota bacterium]